MKLILATSSRFSPEEIVEFENVTILLVANRASVESVAEPPLTEWTSDLDCRRTTSAQNSVGIMLGEMPLAAMIAKRKI